ncbi:acetyl-CoA synthetase (ADP-forming) [Hydrocarboniphaga daqingensis]|uniref:Acetyl-CoA synthetase (ADP-forming) n=1 Tax=Hydrocarboniphaga daqingensis TaxID=490188 RepID=A0A1M5NCM8_9GAMM|nr:GNAT family N-acetyltransferase [Hydrocarboniphaga daqingensis]SHG87251.1 acetyl-CoA synthetase (ADP-forming) [Hydrocarboniphaga daqingensis]
MSAQNLEALLHSRAVLAVGEPSSALERGLLRRLQASADSVVIADSWWSLHAHLHRRDDVPRLAVVFDAALISVDVVDALGASHCRGVIWTSAESIPDAVLQAARPHRLRFVGPRSAGFFLGGGLSAGEFPPDVAAGSLALIAQWGSIAAAAIDWAAGRGIGFSWAVTTGAESDADIADFLDVAALDPATRAVILQLGAVRAGRKFMSAARACARLKPVVVLQSRVGGREALTGTDPVRTAAFARAGLVECSTLDGLFDALTALARIPARPQVRVITVGNGAGLCALGVDAVLRHGLALAHCAPATVDAIGALAPRARALEGAIDAGPVEPQALADLCRRLMADDGVDYVLMVHSPQLDSAHQLYVDALLAAQLGPRLVTVWLGLKTALEARRRSTDAGLATFVTAGQAARALRYRWLHGRTRELLMQTPPPVDREPVDRLAMQQMLQAAAGRGDHQLPTPAADELLARYRLPLRTPAGAMAARGFELSIERHREMGTYLSITAVSGLLRSDTGIGFAPLDGLLAQRMIEAINLPLSERAQAPLAAALLSLSQIALDQPAVAQLRLTLALDERAQLHRIGDASVEVDPTPPLERRRLILAPYPDVLQKVVTTRDGRRYRLRPIRPEDEPALVTLLERLRPDDVRLRFFAAIRYFSHEMAARMTQIDYDRELVLIAQPDDEPETLCAVAHLVIDAYGERGEFALLVHHDHAGSGLGRQLMNELIAHGRAQQLQQIVGDVLRHNRPMLALAAHLGFTEKPHDQEPDCRRVELDLSPGAAATGL